MTLTYFDVFPDAKFKITPKPESEIVEELNPNNVTDLISYLCSQKPPIKWLNIEHPALCKRVFVMVFDGLDNSRFCKYRAELPTFSSLSENGYPVIVLAKQRNCLIVPATTTLLGYNRNQTKLKQFSSYEEMLLSLNKRYDNGYPIKPGTQLPSSTRQCRFEYFKMAPLTAEQLGEYRELPEKVENSLSIIGIDCEMIKTTKGDEVARISAVNDQGETVIDEFLRPLGEVEDYRTQVSGITPEKVSDSSLYTSNQAVEILQKVADQHTILVGHSLENDLRAMKIIHDRVIDTALIYNRDARYPNKPSLSKLYSHYINKDFRVESETKGHDSVEDAKAALELAHNALIAAVSEVEAEPQLPSLFSKMVTKESQDNSNESAEEEEEEEANENGKKVLPKSLEDLKHVNAQINVFGPNFHLGFARIDDRVKCVVKDSSENVARAFLDSLDDVPNLPSLNYVYLYALSHCNVVDEDEIEACKQYDSILKEAMEKIPPMSALIIYTGNGNLKRLKSTSKLRPGMDSDRSAEFTMCRQGLLWIYCKNYDEK